MATVYRIVPDVNTYQFVEADDPEEALEYSFNGHRIGDKWTPPAAYSPHPLQKEGDFWGCFAGTIAIKPEARRPLTTFLDQSCELLELPLEDRTLLLCNVIYVLNCLDKKRSRHKAGLPHWIEDYVFHPRRLGYSLFKIPETRISEILCVEGICAPADELKGFVEMHGLSGLIFQRIWTDEPKST